jgi:hypothetical protein
MLMVDSRTFELRQAFDELVEYWGWVIKHTDVEASRKLRPIVKRIGDLLIAVVEGAVPEMGSIVESLDRFYADAMARLEQATTEDEKTAVLAEVDAFTDKVQKLLHEQSETQAKKLDS